MQIGVIGTGKHGSRYANHIVKDVDGLTLAAISRRSPEGLDQARGHQGGGAVALPRAATADDTAPVSGGHAL